MNPPRGHTKAFIKVIQLYSPPKVAPNTHALQYMRYGAHNKKHTFQQKCQHIHDKFQRHIQFHSQAAMAKANQFTFTQARGHTIWAHHIQLQFSTTPSPRGHSFSYVGAYKGTGHTGTPGRK